MIPVNLRMRNFMPYKGEAPALSFRAIHTACISGDNGAGKSSVIDAITWALWGKSRAKSDDDLIHQGENDTEIEFDFSSGGQLYRIIRKHARPKGKRASGQSSLDLFSVTSSGCIPICGDNKTQTQAKIESILHMDYDTFTNSAYLRQGHADEFTRQPPGKRKEVLANILGLSIYDRYEASAKDSAREAEQLKLLLSAGISEIESEIALKADYEGKLEQIQKTAAEIDIAAAEKEAALKRIRTEEKALESVKTQLSQIETAIEHHKDDLKREEGRQKQSQARIADYKALIDRRTFIESGYEELQKARKLYDELNQQARQVSRLIEKKNQYQRERDKAQSELNTQHRLVENTILQLGAKADKLAVLKLEQQKLSPQRQALEQIEQDVRFKREEMKQKQSKLAEITASTARLEQDISDIDEKLKLLATTGSDAHCPLCESDLSGEKLELVQKKYADEKNEKLRSIGLNENNRLNITAEIKALEAEILRLDSKQKQDSQALAGQESRIAQHIKEANEAIASLADEKDKLAQIEEILALQNYALPEQQALARIETELTGLAYDEKRHDALQTEVERLKPYEEQKLRLDEATKLIAQEQNSAAEAEKTSAAIKSRLAEDDASLQKLTAQLSGLPEITRKLALAEDDFKRISEEQKSAREKLAVLKEQLKRLNEMEKRSAEKRKALDEASEKESLYRELARIFGKKGIQAMLIETALPEIEAEANRLLSRMTDGRMSLTFETQQATKKGDISETLDIRIADELGTRDYEMFSGGEAFRIDFSVRIALSKLLARRAGAPLPTLIIDEGFGTQDADGIEKLKEAINSVQDDFQKILVITHIDELKDAFPARIDVVKKAEGSTIEVS